MVQAADTQSVRFGDNNANNYNTIASYNKSVNKTVYKSDGDAQIMRWLSPLEPNNIHQSIHANRFNGVGDWLLGTTKWMEWRGEDGGADKAVLFCSGNPGVGKTYLSSFVIDTLCDQAGGGDIAVASFYYDFLAQQEQTITDVMGSILRQLVGRDIPKYIRQAFQKGNASRGPRLADLMAMLRTTIASLRQVFICIDALDECLQKNLPELLESLRDTAQRSPTTRIFLTGRPHVREDIQRYFPTAAVALISPNTDDIKNCLEMKFDRDIYPEAMNDNLRAAIVRIILEKVSDIFLLVSLSIDAILGEMTIRQRRKKLDEVKRGNGLSDAYTATLTRLKTQERGRSTLGLKVLTWVLYSERPLREEELCHALGVEMGSVDLDPENVPALRILLASCLGLVTVEESSSTVRLVHSTLQEHLSRNPTLLRNPHSTIAEVCLTYLNFGKVRGLSPNPSSDPTTMPLLEYASYYWGEHTRKGMTENVQLLALKLLDRFDEHISAHLLLLHYNQTRSSGPCFSSAGGPKGFTGLHAVAFLGIVGIVPAVLEMKEWDVNAADCMGKTALTWATRRGKGEVVKVLLEREDIDPNVADIQDGRTPLTLAAENGHVGLVKILLERQDTNPNTADTKYGRTPLSWATWRGHEKVAKMLLEREDIDPNVADTQDGHTPLTLATESGHEGLVKILLERQDTNTDMADTKYGRTPLSWAAWRGHEKVAKMLLKREDINPNTVDTQDGQTPLTLAAEGGHGGLVKILLERQDTDPNMVDTKYGRTPLSWAAKSGHEGVAKMLLGREDVRAAMPDNKNQTPLSLARFEGHDGIVRILLERDNLNPDTRDHRSQASLPLSGINGDEFPVGMRVRDGDPNTEVAAPSGQPVAIPAGEKQVENLVAKEPVENITLNSQRTIGRLKDVITNHRKGLQKMYGGTGAELDKCLEMPTKRGDEMARNLTKEMGCNGMVAKDLSVLTLYDVAILIDDSDSMIYEENGARKKTLIQFVDHITEIYSMANESGILAMRFTNSYQGKENWTGKSGDYLDHHSYGGLTRIGTALKERILDPFAIGNPNQSKPLLVLIVTSSAVDAEEKDHLKKVIYDCVNEREGAGKGRDAISFQFSLIGNDPGAAKLLEDLHQDPDIGEYTDMFTVGLDLERQMEDKWFVLPKILLGAILPDWGEQDGHNYIEEHDCLADKEDSRDDDSEFDWEE